MAQAEIAGTSTRAAVGAANYPWAYNLVASGRGTGLFRP